MTDPSDIRADLEPDAPDEVVLLAERLVRDRPIPAMNFRGALRRRLLAADAVHPRPAGLHRLIARYASAGAALLFIGAVSAAGAGPLGS